MAKELIVSGDLKGRFSQFKTIAEITAGLRRELNEINEQNKTAAGSHDHYAIEYHNGVDQRTYGLGLLVGGIEKFLGLTGDHGHDTSDGFDAAEGHSTDIASSL